METHKELVDRASETILLKDFQSFQNQDALTRGKLVNVRAKAIRRGIWFRVLTRAERAYIELTIKVVNGVRSHFLAKVLTSILTRLLNTSKIKVALDVGKVGHLLAQRLSRIAQNWGNRSASRWVKDQGFIQYLAVTYMNTPATFQGVF